MNYMRNYFSTFILQSNLFFLDVKTLILLSFRYTRTPELDIYLKLNPKLQLYYQGIKVNSDFDFISNILYSSISQVNEKKIIQNHLKIEFHRNCKKNKHSFDSFITRRNSQRAIRDSIVSSIIYQSKKLVLIKFIRSL